MLKPIIEKIPDAIRRLLQWVLWRQEPRRDDPGKMTKVPYQPNGRLAKVNDAATWNSFEAVRASINGFDGVGFVLTKDDPFVALDFDDCRCPALDDIVPWASSLDMVSPEVAGRLRAIDSYTEISPSGRGIRVLVKASLPFPGKRRGPIEVYQSARFVTFTGHVLDGFPSKTESRQAEIDDFCRDVFGPDGAPSEQRPQPQPGSLSGHWRDRLEKAFACKNGEDIKRLFHGDFSAYPSQSEADLAFCAHLAFWFGGDAAAMNDAFRASGLYRPKWEERHASNGRTYGVMTMEKAIAGCRDFYKEPAQDSLEVKGTTPPLEEWSDPIPFDDYSRLPAFPVSSIPGVCGDMVAAVSASCQIDAGLPGGTMLAVLAASAGRWLSVDLGTHVEPANIYTIGIVDSGNRKSAVVAALAEPILAYQRERRQALLPVIREAENKERAMRKRVEELYKSAARTDDTERREALNREAHGLVREIEENPVPVLPVFLCDDITPEALGKLMSAQGETAAVISAEGGLFRIMGGLYHSGGANIDLFLKAHAGDFWSNHRIGRESQMMEHPRLTLGLAVQPNVIEEIGGNSEFRGRGLSARFLYALCQSRAGFRTRNSVPIPTHIKEAYHRMISGLMDFPRPIELTLMSGAQEAWDGFYDDVEKRLRPDGDLQHLVDWGSKLPGAVARIAGLLHFADSAGDFARNQIREATVRSACAIGAYYLEHAKAVFGMMQEDPVFTGGRRILEYIKRCKPIIFKGRDLFNHTNYRKMEEISPALSILVERGFIKEQKQTVSGQKKGRPEATRYEVNPRAFSETREKHQQNPQN